MPLAVDLFIKVFELASRRTPAAFLMLSDVLC
jgi:hypothetical protein